MPDARFHSTQWEDLRIFRAVFAAFLATILFTISITCGYRTSKLIGGVEANFWRLTLATGMLAVWAFTAGAGLRGDAFPVFFVSGLVGIGLGDAALFQALPRLGSRLTVVLVQCLTAPVAALGEWLWLGTTLHWTQVGCVLIILAGVAMALAPGKHLEISRGALTAGVIAAVIAAVGNGLGAVISRKAYAVAQASGEVPDGGTAAFQRLIPGLLVAAVMILIAKREFVRMPTDMDTALETSSTRAKWRQIGPWVLINSLAGQTLGVSAMQWALKSTAAGIVMSIVALTPLTVIPMARYFENELPTRRSIVGGMVAVLGVIGLTWTRQLLARSH